MNKVVEKIELLFAENIFDNLGYLSKLVQGHSIEQPPPPPQKHLIFISPLYGAEGNLSAIQHTQREQAVPKFSIKYSGQLHLKITFISI